MKFKLTFTPSQVVQLQSEHFTKCEMNNGLKIYETNEKQFQHWETDNVERRGMAFIERDTEKWDLGLWALKW